MLTKLFKFTYLLLLLTFFNTFAAKGEILSDINIEGNQRIPDETIKMFGNIKIQQNLNLNDIDQILKNIYDTNFFEDVKVKFKNGIKPDSLKILLEKKLNHSVIHHNHSSALRYRKSIGLRLHPMIEFPFE